MSVVCKTCGAPVERIGNYYVCEYCRNKWEIDSGNDVHAVDRANAWSALRDGDFEKATALFEEIIVKENQNHEAYWGRALALGGIVYVTDLSENKKVPTCNNITEESFVNSKDVQKAIALAPADIAESYRKQAEYIEKVRLEWLEKASKEPAYDVFISFKDSDREHGIERTQDSIDAQDLYNALVADGYKVFFSRISLRDKISEQYEPYIYNAIKTAKVMIVFGEKPEYFNAVWLKNEWMRFKSRIEKGEKHKNSLVVVYKNMNPGDLPAVLRSRQCLNAADMTFLSDLTRHIKRVMEESKRNVHLEKIEITGGQIAKKATSIAVNSVKTREIGAGAIAETSISEQQTLSLAKTYLEASQWDEAAQLVGDVLFENSGCAEAIWYGLLAKYHAEDDTKLQKKFDDFQQEDFATLDKYLNCSSKNIAKEKLTWLWKSLASMRDGTCCAMLNIILPYSFQTRGLAINRTFEHVIQTSKFESFCLLMCTLKPSDVDKYIDYNYQYATKTKENSEKLSCLNRILAVDSGNVAALQMMLTIDLENIQTVDTTVKHLETLLKYAPDANSEVASCLQWLCGHLVNIVQVNFAQQLIRYYNGEISELKDYLIKLSYRIIEQSLFDGAEYFLNLILTFDPQNSDVYWAICLMKVQAKSESDIPNSKKNLTDISEFNKYLTLVDLKRKKECIRLIEMQKFSIYQEKCIFAQGLIQQGVCLNIHTLSVFADMEDCILKNMENPLFHVRIKRQWKIDDGRLIVQKTDNTLWMLTYGDLFEQLDIDYAEQVVDVHCISCRFYKLSHTLQLWCYRIAILYKNGAISSIAYSHGYEIAEHRFSYNLYIPEDFLLETDKDFADYIAMNGKILCHRYLPASVVSSNAIQIDGGNILEKNGTLKYYHMQYKDENDEYGKLVVEDYKFSNVVQIICMGGQECALFLNGTIKALEETDELKETEWYQEISKLSDIVAVGDANAFSCCLKKDGTVVKILIDADTDRILMTVLEGKCFDNFDTIIEDYEESVRKYEQQLSQQKNENHSSVPASGNSATQKQGCYVATCVYGSYDCPQVWMLRRFRDNVLAKTWYGRAFIRTYYAISPTLVKMFGHTMWFKKLWKGKLDRMVEKLNAQGVNNTPYNDYSL